MKVRFNRWYNAVLTALLSILGFGCSSEEPMDMYGPPVEYGTPQADFILKYQVVKGFYKSNDSVLQLVGKILREKYNLPWQDKFLNKALESAQGKRNALIDIPQFNYKENVETIYDKFIENKFDKMVNDVITHGLGMYPLPFRDIIERYS